MNARIETMATTGGTVTAAELLEYPRGAWRYELVRGEVRRMSPAGDEHGFVSGRLFLRLGRFVEDHGLGAMYGGDPGFLLETDPDTVRAPDVAFVSRASLDAVPPGKGFRAVAPDLLAEVVSPNDRFTEVREKVQQWLDAGVSLVFVVDPEQRTVDVHAPGAGTRTLTEADTLDGGPVVPGWSMPVAELFPAG